LSWLWAIARWFGEWRIAFHIDTGKLKLPLSELSLRLLEGGLKRSRIDLKQNLALLNLRAFYIGLLDHVAAYLWLNLSIDITLQSANPFPNERNVLLRRRRHGDR